MGFSPTGKRRLCTAHAKVRHCALPLGCFVGAAKARERHGDAKCFHGLRLMRNSMLVACSAGRFAEFSSDDAAGVEKITPSAQHLT